MSDPVRLADLLYRFRSISFQHTWAEAATMFNIVITVPTIVSSSKANHAVSDSSSGSESYAADTYLHIGVEHKGYLKLQIGQSIHASYMNNKFKSNENDDKDNEELSGLFSEISREYAILENSPQIIVIE